MAPAPASGRWANAPTWRSLVVILVFGAFANAAGMVGPVLAWRERLGSLLGQPSPLLVTSLFYFFGLLVLPLVAVGGAAVLSRRWGRLTGSWFEVATRYSYALVPIGFSMWLAHYSFHFLTSYDTVVPTTQRFVADLGWSALGQPHWVAACCRRRGGLAATPGGALPGLRTAAVAVRRLSHRLGPVAATVASLAGTARRGRC